ncbi:MAG: hypothetical protein E7F88_22345 [Serratia marcescens]|nr:hypothetical protein [Serratia marcescens]
MAAIYSKLCGRGQGDAKIFYCQVETYFGTKEYARHGRCVRLIGIEEGDFHNLRKGGEDGVTTHIIDLDFWRYFQQRLSLAHWWEVLQHIEMIKTLEAQLHGKRSWFIIEIETGQSSADYYYPTFSKDEPTYIGAFSIKPVRRKGLPDLTKSIKLQVCQSFLKTEHSLFFDSYPNFHCGEISPLIHRRGSSVPYRFHAFHVGQGMCSLVDNGQFGYLLDAGAGKPVTRKRYFDKTKPMLNDLALKVQLLAELVMVTSHTDYDHWKLLAWDTNLRTKIRAIMVPYGVDHLLFKDKEIIKKCFSTSSMKIKLADNTFLELIRSKPSFNDANGDCIVTVFTRGAERVLAPGDYVYSRFTTDSSSHIKNLHQHSYKAVIVPHHGDKESANNVVIADSPDAHAFFSAGTHGYYKHPTYESRTKHKAANFVEICDETKDYIKAVLLL